MGSSACIFCAIHIQGRVTLKRVGGGPRPRPGGGGWLVRGPHVIGHNTMNIQTAAGFQVTPIISSSARIVCAIHFHYRVIIKGVEPQGAGRARCGTSHRRAWGCKKGHNNPNTQFPARFQISSLITRAVRNFCAIDIQYPAMARGWAPEAPAKPGHGGGGGGHRRFQCPKLNWQQNPGCHLHQQGTAHLFPHSDR